MDWFEHAGVPFDAIAAAKLGMMEPSEVARIGIDAVLAGKRTRVAQPARGGARLDPARPERAR